MILTALLISSSLLAQSSADSVFKAPIHSISEIPNGIADIDVDQEGNLYLLQTDRHRIYKYFKVTDYDSVQVIGGKGIGAEGFNFPTKITVPNRQSIWVLDQMNRRLVQMNTNLKVIAEVNFLTLEASLSNSGIEDFWPVSIAVGPSGELFYLNQEDIRVYKFRTNGSLERYFGGLDYGNGSLEDPWDIVVNGANQIFAVDSTNQRLSLFDLFGTYLYALEFPLDFRWKRLVTVGNNLFLIGDHSFFIYNLFSKRGETIRMEQTEKLIDLAGGKDFIYVLFENKVDLYPLNK